MGDRWLLAEVHAVVGKRWSNTEDRRLAAEQTKTGEFSYSLKVGGCHCRSLDLVCRIGSDTNGKVGRIAEEMIWQLGGDSRKMRLEGKRSMDSTGRLLYCRCDLLSI